MTAKKAPSQKNKVQKKIPKLPKPSKSEVITREFDASGIILGRLATQVANALRGKGKPSYRPNAMCGDNVVVFNAAKMKISGNKLHDKIYYHHTGYIGHLKSESMGDVFKKNPGEILRRAVSGMLPKNKLRVKWLKNLTILSGESQGEKNASKN